MAATTLEIDTFADADALRQLEIIDQLRELGIGDEIGLPQLVVVGDQSSGKSSLLEGLTGLEFPTASQLCTRFATQVSFRRTVPGSPEKTAISIVPAPDSDKGHRENLESFTRNVSEVSGLNFASVLDEAAERMGLPSKRSPDCAKRFSSDVLKFEISGPTQQHLSIVDVPGLYHNPTDMQTEEDLQLIRDLIDRYICDSCTIIIAVLNATNNLANQEVFKIARQVDKRGTRTVGVMTKLDALQHGDEAEVLNIAANKSFPLKLGWYCVRNRTTKEVRDGVSIQQRHELERHFFKATPWNTLPSTSLGTVNLKASLGGLLADLVAREFPRIRKTISAELEKRESDVQQLGPPRQTFQEQMQHLTQAAVQFQALAVSELKAQSLHLSHDSAKHVMLRTRVRKAYEEFDNDMSRNGRTMSFLGASRFIKMENDVHLDFSSDDEENSSSSSQSEYNDDSGRVENDNPAENTKYQKSKHKNVYFEDHGQGSPSLAKDAPRTLYDEIHQRWSRSRGTELSGLINPAVLEVLFQFQTSKWEPIANSHLEEIKDMVLKCYRQLLRKVLKGTGILERLGDALESDVDYIVERASKELNRILHGERKGILHTTNHYFAENIEKSRAERARAAASEQYANSEHIGNREEALYTIHDTLKSYYKVALKRFIDNFGLYVVEQELLGPAGPLSLFSPHWVAGLNAEELAELAGEDTQTTLTRTNLQQQIDRLRKAQDICGKKKASGK